MLPNRFLSRPIAHRGLHDAAQGRIENAPLSIKAAIQSGYGIEIDVQLSRDDAAIVFHDYQLERLTGRAGRVRDMTCEQLQVIPLLGSNDTLTSLAHILKLVRGQVPLLIELKDQDGALGADVGPLEQAVVSALAGYGGDVAVMSFNPHSIDALGRLNPALARGLVTDPFTVADWPNLTPKRRAEVQNLGAVTKKNIDFISHNKDDLQNAMVQNLRNDALPVLCWTITSKAQEQKAHPLADNITFEGYLP